MAVTASNALTNNVRINKVAISVVNTAIMPLTNKPATALLPTALPVNINPANKVATNRVSRAVTNPVNKVVINPVSKAAINNAAKAVTNLVSRAVINRASRAAINNATKAVTNNAAKAATNNAAKVATSNVAKAVTNSKAAISKAVTVSKVAASYQQRGKQGGYQQRGKQGGYQQRGKDQGIFPGRGKSFTPRPKRIEYEMPIPDPNELIRLNKFMSNAGICSRREADEFIQQGLVKVNGVVVTELGTKICHSDVVEYDEKVVALESKCYILLNKPKDCVTTVEDPQGRTTVLDLVKGACDERIYPVGRLDRNTTGVLLLTNDGDLASKLTHPKYVKKKIYHVWCDKDITEEDMQRIADGIELDDGPIHADAISYATETDRNQAGIEIHSGRNRIVRRIFESLGYHVTKLDRVYFAGLTKKNLPRGRWRYLTQEEVNHLKMGAFE